MRSKVLHKTSHIYTYFLKEVVCNRGGSRQHVDAVGCSTCFCGLINMSNLTFCIFLDGASRSVVGAMHRQHIVLRVFEKRMLRKRMPTGEG
jgi:hypothetical protein